jgi:hypothetical protein
MIKRMMFGMVAVFMLSVTAAFAQQGQKMQQMSGKEGMPCPQGQEMKKKMTFEDMAKMDEERIDKRVQAMTARLNLMPEQQAKVKDVMSKTAAQIRTLMKDMHDKIKGLMSQDKENIKALLTAEQKAEMDKEPQGPPPMAGEGQE